MKLSKRDLLALHRIIALEQLEDGTRATAKIVAEAKSDETLTDDQRQVFENDIYPSMVEELTCWCCG